MTTDRHFLPLPYSLASSRAHQLSFVQVSSRMSLLVIISMILVFMAVVLMLVKLLTECVSWNGQFSNKFSVSNGVRQGGVLSPILFTVYVDDLLTELENKGVGYYWNNHFVGALCYADDIALLAPSPAALRLMLDTYSSFASSRSLLFNVYLSKTQLSLVRFSRTCFSSPASFFFNGLELNLGHSAKHLGHLLSFNLSDTDDIVRVKNDLVRKANCMLHSFSPCNPLVKTKLFDSFCLSLYGSALWFSSSPELRSLEVSFNNILRRIWSLPRMCHTGILHCTAHLNSI